MYLAANDKDEEIARLQLLLSKKVRQPAKLYKGGNKTVAALMNSKEARLSSL
jgi:hypothetical protein